MELVRIWFIDDNQDNCMKDLGIKNNRYKNLVFETAENNKEARGKLLSNSYDVIIYDLGLDDNLLYFTFLHEIRDLKSSSILITVSVDLDSYRVPSNCYNDQLDTYDLELYKLLRVLQRNGIEVEDNDEI